MIVREALSRMMSTTVNGGFISDFWVRARNDGSLSVFHLLFADDTLIFCGIALDYFQYLRCVLLCFEAIS